MRIVLIYRAPCNEAHSIEELFNAIGKEMSKHVEVIKFVAGSRLQFFSDIKRLRKLKADVYHITGSVNYLALLLPHKKTIVTIHDLVHLIHTLKGFERWLYKWMWMVLPIKYARVVTAISNSTVDDIHNYLGFKHKNIQVIPNCYNSIIKPVDKTFAKECPTIFQIGTVLHKNVSRIIKAISGLNCKFVIVGKLSDSLKNELAQYNIKYENYFNITFDEIYQLYAESDIVTFVSLTEGFGMPVIEAQAIGRPIITTNYAPMSIVAGQGACLVDPLSVEAIRAGILKIINDDAYRNKLVEAGSKNILQYSIEGVTKRYLDVYKQISSN